MNHLNNLGKEILEALKSLEWRYKNLLKDEKVEFEFDTDVCPLCKIVKRRFRNEWGLKAVYPHQCKQGCIWCLKFGKNCQDYINEYCTEHKDGFRNWAKMRLSRHSKISIFKMKKFILDEVNCPRVYRKVME